MDDKELLSSTPETEPPKDEAVPIQAENAATQETKAVSTVQKTRPVIFYIVIMFAVALFLIILSFFMQQRNHEALLKGLSSSADQVQSIIDLELEKDKLTETLDNTKQQLANAQEEQKKLQEAVDTASKQVKAMDYLMQAGLLYAANKQNQARDLLSEMQKQGLQDALPTSSSLPNQVSPKQQFDELLGLLS